MMKRMVVLVIVASTLIYGDFCTTHVKETVTAQKTKDTKKMIKQEEDKIKIEIDKYKEALEAKKKMMTKLWKATAEIEHLMRQNQALRKEIIKHWESVKQTQSVSK